MAQNYDNMAKDLFTNHPIDISRFVLGLDQVEVLENLDTEQQIITSHRTDTAARIRVQGREAILHVELQLRDSTQKPMWARNAAYQGYLIGEHQIPVYSNVIYFHPSAGRNDPGRYEYSWNGYDYTLAYKVIRLIEVEGQAVLETQLPGKLPFTPLMKPPEGMDLERWVQECVDATLEISVDQRTQADLLYALTLFGGVVYDAELFRRLIPEELMRESRFYQHLRDEFISQGVEMGISQGVEMGSRETLVRNILVALRVRFPTAAVDAFAPALQDISDLQRLETLYRSVLQAQNLDTFTQELNK